MRTFLTIATLLAAPAAFSQSNGVIFGLLSDNVAHLVASAPIEAKNVDTGATFKIESGATGEYRITGLPAGDYILTVSINTIGNFAQPKLKVTDAGPVRFDIILPLP